MPQTVCLHDGPSGSSIANRALGLLDMKLSSSELETTVASCVPMVLHEPQPHALPCLVLWASAQHAYLLLSSNSGVSPCSLLDLREGSNLCLSMSGCFLLLALGLGGIICCAAFSSPSSHSTCLLRSIRSFRCNSNAFMVSG